MISASERTRGVPVCRRFLTWVPGFEDYGLACHRRHVDASSAAVEHVEELLAEDSSFELKVSVLVATVDLKTREPKLIEVVRSDEPGVLFTTPAPPRARDALLVSWALVAPALWAQEGTPGNQKGGASRDR